MKIAVIGNGRCADLFLHLISGELIGIQIIKVAARAFELRRDQIKLTTALNINFNKYFICTENLSAQKRIQKTLTSGNVNCQKIFTFEGEHDINYIRAATDKNNISIFDFLMTDKISSTAHHMAKSLTKSEPLETRKIGFHYYGSGGGFKSQLEPIKDVLSEDVYVEFSDQIHNDKKVVLAPLSFTKSITSLDLAISSHFINVSHENVTKLTFMHVLLDFCIFEQTVMNALAYPSTHYVFCSTKPNFFKLKELIESQHFKNRIILIPGGYPFFDANFRTLQASKIKSKRKILVAPTVNLRQPEYNVNTYMAPMLPELLTKLAYHYDKTEITLRLHPQDMADYFGGIDSQNAQNIRKAIEIAKNTNNILLNSSRETYLEDINDAAVLISDTSSIAYSFHFLTQKPVIFLNPDQEIFKTDLRLSSFYSTKIRSKMATLCDSVDDVIRKVDNCLTMQTYEKSYFADQVLYNFGRSAEYFKRNIDTIISKDSLDNWYSNQ